MEEEPKHRAMRRWLGAGCALALMCVCVSPAALAQTSSSPSKADASKPKAKPSDPKRHSKTATKSKAETAPAAKTRRASHSAAGTHSKSNPAAATQGNKSKSASSRQTGNSKTTKSKTGKRRTTARGQQKIDSERAQAIQEALIREHYLSGDAAGTWNQASEEAMRRYQADHGWQSKTVPDSRALISLGLGPSHDHLLNPESAMTMGPFPPRSASLTTASHSADPGASLSTAPAAPPAPAKAPDQDATRPQ